MSLCSDIAKSERVEIDGFLNDRPSPEIDLYALGVSFGNRLKTYLPISNSISEECFIFYWHK